MRSVENIFINSLLSIALLKLASDFFYASKSKKSKWYMDWDRPFFRLVNPLFIQNSNRKAMWTCIMLSLIILCNGVLAFYFNVENISMIFFVMGIFVIPSRYIYIYILFIL